MLEQSQANFVVHFIDPLLLVCVPHVLHALLVPGQPLMLRKLFSVFFFVFLLHSVIALKYQKMFGHVVAIIHKKQS